MDLSISNVTKCLLNVTSLTNHNLLQLLYHKVHLATTWQGDEMIWSPVKPCTADITAEDATMQLRSLRDGLMARPAKMSGAMAAASCVTDCPHRHNQVNPWQLVTAAWQLRDSLPGWQTPAASSQSLRRVRPGEVAWPVTRHRIVTGAWCPLQWPGVSIISREMLVYDFEQVWGVLVLLCCSVFLDLLMEERFCEIKIPLLMEYWSGKVLKRATSGRLQTQCGPGWQWGTQPVTRHRASGAGRMSGYPGDKTMV